MGEQEDRERYTDELREAARYEHEDCDAEINHLRALVEKRERQIVWAVRNCLGLIRNGHAIVNDDYTIEIAHDGTDADILRAVREAMGDGK